MLQRQPLLARDLSVFNVYKVYQKQEQQQQRQPQIFPEKCLLKTLENPFQFQTQQLVGLLNKTHSTFRWNESCCMVLRCQRYV